ncbi:MAG TPA: hypothetical protein DCQ31_14895 [Bacteroidales bacterium]|nr:hypothetical protein [Bacteroidales bacterium]
MTANELTKKLKSMGAFWSYDATGLQNIPENVLIEDGLRWGDVAEILCLFEIFGQKKVKQVWKEKLIIDARIYDHNYYLGTIFFDIKNPKRYMKHLLNKNSRYERIKTFNA